MVLSFAEKAITKKILLDFSKIRFNNLKYFNYLVHVHKPNFNFFLVLFLSFFLALLLLLYRLHCFFFLVAVKSQVLIMGKA